MRKIDRLRWRRGLAQSIVIALIIATLVLLVTRSLRQNAYQSLEKTQTTQAMAAASSPQLSASWVDGDGALQALVDEWTLLTGDQFAILNPGGEVVANSAATPLNLTELNRAPDLMQMRQGDIGLAYGALPADDSTIDNPYLFIAVPIVIEGKDVGILRLMTSTAPVEAALRRFAQRLGLLSVAAALLIIGLMFMQMERTARSVRRLTDAADRITAGDLSARVLSLGRDDVGQLMHAFNRMASKLESQIHKRKRETDRLNTIMYVMADGVLILSRKGKVRMINPAAANLLGIAQEKALKRSYVQAVRDHRIASVWVRCRESGQQEVSVMDLGVDRLLRVIVTPFLSDNSRGYVVVIQDLTRLHRLQTVRQDFVSNVSHELRTPLASIRALVDTLRDGALDDPPAASHFLDRMEIEVDSLTQMVQELLELSRIESGRVPLRLSSVPVDSMIAVGVDRLRPQAERADVALGVAPFPDLPPVLADSERIQQVITNLVHNAIKFTPAGGRIDIYAARHTPQQDDSDGPNQNGDKDATDEVNPLPEMIVIAIVDTGIGIVSTDLPRIFERFYKTDPARTGGGTGLGLAIAKHVVQTHGGEIWAESVAGHGSTFFFTLPVAATPRVARRKVRTN